MTTDIVDTEGRIIPFDLADPLSVAVGGRDRDVLETVERAVAEGRTLLAYQPVLPAPRPDKPAFYEGLIRVLDESGRIIPARDFMDRVEDRETGRWIDVHALEHGLDTLRRKPELRLSINLSAKTIDFPPWSEVLDRTLAQDPTLGERLILEITERTAILMPERVRHFMDRLQSRGIGFAIDDFGSGYTSLRYLKDLYFDILKIDGSFVRGISKNGDDRAVVASMVALAHHFDMVTVAEWVETAEDAATLATLGVDCLQGYHFGAPTIRPQLLDCRRRVGAR
ncbi:EAL domain-containing protein [Palleronia sediminis]|uniref:EAL domain-containing protein n=1 Tax=Palleronia sediminis TaxID=2547833 RepID=A0A4R6A119_9RHOB|nr:EAL domain-containing protein [Palleronia sediminis]TDL76355.1 EAL domain-containing protein [Palleronia sediminis]